MIARGAGAVCVALLALATPARSAPLARPFAPSRLVMAMPSRTPLLAQRVIDREWGPSEDSVYVEKEVQGWRSEGGATLLSAAVPGAGEAYSDDAVRGAWFALAEIAGWTAHYLLHRSGVQSGTDAAHFAGSPSDSNSAWSFTRWSQATHSSVADLQRLYSADPESFYEMIASDPSLLAGWSGDASDTRQHFAVLRDARDRRLYGARFAESLVWVNHLVAAMDAFRTAHLHNMKLGPALGLRVKTGWRRGGPELMASIERSF